eukprot:gene2725-5371_t
MHHVNYLGKDFIKIHTPKLIGGASKGGSNVVNLQYFERVFEIRPVFRVENSDTLVYGAFSSTLLYSSQ